MNLKIPQRLRNLARNAPARPPRLALSRKTSGGSGRPRARGGALRVASGELRPLTSAEPPEKTGS